MHAFCAGLMAIGIGCAEPAAAQLLPYPLAGSMPPHEAVALVRSAGLEPTTRPVRAGPAIVLNAVNPAGREVRVIVDPRQRRIVRMVAVGPARAAPDVAAAPAPAPYGRPPADIGSVPDPNLPAARAGASPPDGNDAEPYPGPRPPSGQVASVGSIPAGMIPSGAVAPAPARTPAVNAAPAATSQTAPPPLPRPRPTLAAAEPVAPAPSPSAASNTPAKPVQPRAASAATAAQLRAYEPVYEEHE